MAIWEKIYELIGWENQPSTKTPINARNLNKMDIAINELDDRVLDLGGSVESILGNFATEYDSTSTYAVGDYVIHDGLLYKCITAVTTAEEFDSSKWKKTDCGAEFDESSSKMGRFFDLVWSNLQYTTDVDIYFLGVPINDTTFSIRVTTTDGTETSYSSSTTGFVSCLIPAGSHIRVTQSNGAMTITRKV